METVQHLATSQPFITQGRRMRDFLNLFPQGIGNLLLIIDPADRPEPVLAVVLQLAEQWHPVITLSHGGGLRHRDRPAGRSDRDDMVDLLCLGWELKNRYSDVSISRTILHSLQQLVREATERQADVILIPEAVATGLQPAESVSSEAGARSMPCPIVVVPTADMYWPEANVDAG
jgi:hypothetical protein